MWPLTDDPEDFAASLQHPDRLFTQLFQPKAILLSIGSGGIGIDY